jgi:methylamine dehydrogenase accessory protein MauD
VTSPEPATAIASDLDLRFLTPGAVRLEVSLAMNTFLLIANLALWIVVLFFGFLLLGALRALALLRWRVAQLEAITPSRVARSGLRPGKKAPGFALPSIAGGTEGSEVGPHLYAGRKLLLVFMQPGCGPCHEIAPELNRLHDAGEVQVMVIHNGDTEAVRRWIQQNRPRFSVARQDHFNLSKRYEVFATPFGFLIDEAGVIASRGIVSNKQFLGFVLTGAGQDQHEGEGPAEESQGFEATPAGAGQASRSYSEEIDHV